MCEPWRAACVGVRSAILFAQIAQRVSGIDDELVQPREADARFVIFRWSEGNPIADDSLPRRHGCLARSGWPSSDRRRRQITGRDGVWIFFAHAPKQR